MEQVTYGTMRPEELPRLLHIFSRCFGCEEEGEYVLKHMGYLTQYVARVGDTPAAMLSALPVYVRCGGRAFSAAYLYGVSTDPAFQGRGLCTGLMEYTHRQLVAAGMAFSLLVPSSEKNRRFYLARGYTDCSTLCSGNFTVKEPSALMASPVSPEEYAPLRAGFSPADAMLWGEKGLSFQQGWLSLFGGGLYRLTAGEKTVGCAAFSVEETGPWVRELLVTQKLVAPALSALCMVLSSPSVRFTLAEGQGAAWGMSATPAAMFYPLAAGQAVPTALYANLVLD